MIDVSRTGCRESKFIFFCNLYASDGVIIRSAFWEMLSFDLQYSLKCQNWKIGKLKCWGMVMTDTSICAYLQWFYECFCASPPGCQRERTGRASCWLRKRTIWCLASSELNVRLVTWNWCGLQLNLSLVIKKIIISVYQLCLDRGVTGKIKDSHVNRLMYWKFLL